MDEGMQLTLQHTVIWLVLYDLTCY